MEKILDVIEELSILYYEHGNLNVKIVNYHSDGHTEDIENVKEAVRVENGSVIIGGESY